MESAVFAPLVSIIIPVYNGSNYMREAIDSALAQTYENIEILVVNDGSSDRGRTEAIAKEYGDKIRYIYKENGGVSSALNAGIRHMRGEYFSWLSHDDVYTPDKIEKQVKALSRLPDKSTLICCDYAHIDKDSMPIGGMSHAHAKEVGIRSWEKMLLDLFRHGPVNGCALLIRKTVFDDVGLFDESLRFYQDGFMWYKIFLAGYAVFSIPDVCVLGRIHGKQLTQTGQSIFVKDCEKISAVMIPQLTRISTAEHNFLLAYGKYHAKYGHTTIVKRVYARAKGTGLISLKDRVAITLLRLYAGIRPALRRIYYAALHR